jgi:hypothetical protein
MLSGRIAAECVAVAGGGREAAAEYACRLRSEVMPALNRVKVVGGALYSLGPRGIERAAGFPPARFIVRRLGWWNGPERSGGTLVVESTKSGRGQ